MHEREVMFTGIGGQGIQLAAKTLALAATQEGRYALMSGTYGAEMRGGHSDATVVVGPEPLRSLPIVARAWSAFAMHDRFWSHINERLEYDAVAVVNDSLFELDLDAAPVRAHRIPAAEIAADLGNELVAGFVLLGSYAAITGLVPVDALVRAMQTLVPPYRTQHLADNEAALRRGAEVAPALAAPAWDAGAQRRAS